METASKTKSPEPEAVDLTLDDDDKHTATPPRVLKEEEPKTRTAIETKKAGATIDDENREVGLPKDQTYSTTEHDSHRIENRALKEESPEAIAKIKSEPVDVSMNDTIEKLNPDHGYDDADSDSSDFDCDDPNDGDFIEDDGSPESDKDSDSEEEPQPASKVRKQDEPKARRPPAKTTHEYWQRWSEEDVKRRNARLYRKRKRTGNDVHDVLNYGPRKARKIANSDGETSKEGCKTSSVEEAPTMPSIKATTQKAQFDQIRANMAKGGDTRHSATQERDLKRAAKSFGYKRVKAVNGKWKLAHTMRTGLLGHQLTLASWMCRREVCGEPKGGLIADEMGMGKTIVSLACMAEHPAEESDVRNFSKATLVVVPNRTIANQWEAEIQKHCKGRLADKVAIHPRQGGQNNPALRQLRSRFAV